MPPTENFDAWLEEELRALLPASGAPAPARRMTASGAHRWSRLLGWLLPPISGKLLVATTALAVAGTAAAASGHVSLPPDHPNRAVVRGMSPALPAAAPPGTTGLGATTTGEGADGTEGLKTATPGRASDPAPEPAAEAPAAAAYRGESPEPAQSPAPTQSAQLKESPEPSSPSQAGTTSPPER